jgi:hypothetical protein
VLGLDSGSFARPLDGVLPIPKIPRGKQGDVVKALKDLKKVNDKLKNFEKGFLADKGLKVGCM